MEPGGDNLSECPDFLAIPFQAVMSRRIRGRRLRIGPVDGGCRELSLLSKWCPA